MGQSMSSLPWVYRPHIADAKIRKFETALQAIAGLDWTTMTRVALERQGLAGSAWEWTTDPAQRAAELK
jgi:hypothetical protein